MLLTNMRMLLRLQQLGNTTTPHLTSASNAAAALPALTPISGSLQDSCPSSTMGMLSSFITGTLLQVPGSSLQRAYMQQCAALLVAQQLQQMVQQLQQANAAASATQLGQRFSLGQLQQSSKALAVAAELFESLHELVEELDLAVQQLPSWAVALSSCSWTARALEDLVAMTAALYSSCQTLQLQQPLLADRLCRLAASVATSLQHLATAEAPGMRTGAVLTDPAAAGSLIRFSSSPDYLGKLREVYAALEIGTVPHMPNMLTSADDAYWKAVRQATAPCFSISNLKQVFPWVLQLCDKAVRHVNSSSSAAAAGSGAAAAAAIDAMRWRRDVQRGRSALAIHDQLMSAKLRAQLASPPPEYTITGHLLKVRDPATGQPLSFDQMKAEMAIIMAAGFETTSNALVWTMAALATHPEVQDTLAAELAAAAWHPTSSSSSRRRRESLRLFSPAALGSSRYCHKDIELLGHVLPKGTHVIIPPYPIGVSVANYGPTADRFIPERWLDQQQLQHLDALREAAGLAPHVLAAQQAQGHVSTLLSDRCPVQLAEWANAYGPVYKLQVLNSAIVVLTDPTAANSLIRWGSSDTYLGKTRELYAALEIGTVPHMPNILTSADGAYWKAVRQATAPCFSISNLKKVFPWVLQLCDKAVRHMNSSSSAAAAGSRAAAAVSIDVEDLAKRFTADVIGHMLKSQYLEIFAALLEEVHAHFSNPLRPLMLKAMPWRRDVQRGRSALAIHDRLMGAKLRAQLASPPPEYTITGHLLKVRDPATGQPLSFAQAKAEMGIMMGAGFETTSHALSWTMAALATHPEVQDTLAAELAAAGLAPNHQQQQQQQQAAPRVLEWGDLALPYLNAVMKESLRLFSPAALGSSRHCHKDVTLLGHVLPKGMHVLIPPYPIGVSVANYGPTADRFIPERWLDQQQLQHLDALREAAGLAPHVLAAAAATGLNPADSSCGDGRKPPDNLSFSSGPRDCVGQSLAKLELQALLATVAGHFVLSPGQELQRQLAAATAPAGSEVDQHGEGPVCNPADVLKRCIMYHVTLQPKAGMVLQFAPRR
ncbi:cytochrome P450 [Scenedesmus sp. NREL 46B-D3]|nr:cytochrome P450 [Scenedesmus sp. NREL 46B-D3]